MASDRAAVLTVQAARRGVVDFSKARIRDVAWWRRTNILIDDMARSDELELLKAAFQFQLALVSNAQLTEESWKKARQHGLDLFNDMVALLRPWGPADHGLKKEISSLRERYKKLIGDPADPEFKKVIAAEAKRMLSTPADEHEETGDERVDRLFRERMQSRR